MTHRRRRQRCQPSKGLVKHMKAKHIGDAEQGEVEMITSPMDQIRGHAAAPAAGDREDSAPGRETAPRDRYINRELSWLEFNRRVLEEAANPHHPLLERLRFLAISAANMDEFNIVRVAGLMAQHRTGIKTVSDDGLTPAEQLAVIRVCIGALMQDQQDCWRVLREELREAGIAVVNPSELTATDLDGLAERFMSDILPILTPLAIDPAHPFPFIANRGVGLALQLHDTERNRDLDALVLLPAQIDRFIRIPGPHPRFILLEQVGSSTGCFPSPSRSPAMACSAFCATARWRSTRKPKI